MAKIDHGRRSKEVKGQIAGEANYASNKFTYLNVDFTRENREELAAYIETGECTIGEFLTLASQDYRCSVSPVEGGKGYTASLVDCGTSSPFYNTCLTGRGSSPANAVASVLYKHIYMLAADWTNATPKVGGDFG